MTKQDIIADYQLKIRSLSVRLQGELAEGIAEIKAERDRAFELIRAEEEINASNESKAQEHNAKGRNAPKKGTQRKSRAKASLGQAPRTDQERQDQDQEAA